jgi:hypothetical protein
MLEWTAAKVQVSQAAVMTGLWARSLGLELRVGGGAFGLRGPLSGLYLNWRVKRQSGINSSSRAEEGSSEV